MEKWLAIDSYNGIRMKCLLKQPKICVLYVNLHLKRG